ncbi:MAG: hypothetical protein MMC23_007406 [Stictis urceolatum]|nr:hypothetical protein [Stictis urceolata]
MRFCALAGALLGATASVRASWLPGLGRRDLPASAVAVTEILSIRDACSTSGSPQTVTIPNVVTVTVNPQPSFSDNGGNGGSGTELTTTLTTFTATSTIFATHTTTVTLQTPPAVTVTTTCTETSVVSVGSSTAGESATNTEGLSKISVTAQSTPSSSYIVIFSTVTVEPLPTAPPSQAHTSTTEVTTIYTTRTTTNRITVPGPVTSSSKPVLSTAPYGNATSLASSTCTESLGTSVAGTGVNTSSVGTAYSVSTSAAASASSSICLESSVAGASTTASSSTIVMGSSASSPLNVTSAVAPTTYISVTSFPMSSAASGISTSCFTNSSIILKRQVGATVIATISGKTVTWVNTYSPTVPIVYSSAETSSVAPMSSSSARASSAQTSTSSLSLSHTRGPISLSSASTSKIPSSVETSATFITVPTSSRTVARTTVVPDSKTSPGAPSATCSGANAGVLKIDFDDLPQVGASNDTTSYAPFQSPHKNLYWANGFSYVPLPKDPYVPSSPPHLAIYIVDPKANVHTDNVTEIGDDVPSGDDINGMIGAGPRFREPAFWFNANSARVGCQNAGPEICVIRATGFRYEPVKDVSKVMVREHYKVHPCNATSGCQLTQIGFAMLFQNLTALQINAFKNHTDGTETPVNWFMVSQFSVATAAQSYPARSGKRQPHQE